MIAPLMSPLFGKGKPEEGERVDAPPPRLEAERLLTMSVAELAAEILPWWDEQPRDNSPSGENGIAEIVVWLTGSKPGVPALAQPESRAVEEAIQRLEHAALLVRRFSISGGSRLRLTRLGEAALADGKVPEHLSGAGER